MNTEVYNIEVPARTLSEEGATARPRVEGVNIVFSKNSRHSKLSKSATNFLICGAYNSISQSVTVYLS